MRTTTKQIRDALEAGVWYERKEICKLAKAHTQDVYNAEASGELISKPHPAGGRAKLYALPPEPGEPAGDVIEEPPAENLEDAAEDAELDGGEPLVDPSLTDDPEELLAEVAGAECVMHEWARIRQILEGTSFLEGHDTIADVVLDLWQSHQATQESWERSEERLRKERDEVKADRNALVKALDLSKCESGLGELAKKIALKAEHADQAVEQLQKFEAFRDGPVTSTYDLQGAVNRAAISHELLEKVEKQRDEATSAADVANRSNERLRQKIDRMRAENSRQFDQNLGDLTRIEEKLDLHPLSSLVIEKHWARTDLVQWVGVFLDVAHERIQELEQRLEVSEHAAAELDAGEFVPVGEHEDLKIAHRAVLKRASKLEEALDRVNGFVVLRRAPEPRELGDVDVLVEACWKVVTGRGDAMVAIALHRYYESVGAA